MDKWDLDQNLSTTIDRLTLGIIGLGEIGVEVTRRLHPWGIKILYYDPIRKEDAERQFPGIEYVPKMEDVFAQANVVSLHLPLFSSTYHIVGKKLLRLMKPGALLVNMARGAIIDIEALLSLLENEEIAVNLAFDVYEEEPILTATLDRFKKVLLDRPNLRFTFMPHNASADANTRGQMAVMVLEDLIAFSKVTSVDDLQAIHLIPSHRQRIDAGEIRTFRINKWFE